MDQQHIPPFLSEAVEKHHAAAIALSDDLYAHPELPDQEFRSSKKIVELLEEAGFAVEYPYMGFPTAFRAVLDNGEGPSSAIMVEYDALPGLGHACGHNAHGSMAVLAALALADLKDKFKGKLYVFGTPAEEERGGKVPMADQGVFDGMSLAIMIHSYSGGVATANMDALSLKCYIIDFTGESSHAAGAPWNGRNALTAARKFLDLMDARREGFTADTRFSGVILDGGKAPNIIPDKATVRVEFRTDAMGKMAKWDRIVQNCAKGAALAMDCEVSFTLGFDPWADVVRVPALEEEAYAVMDEMGQKHIPVPSATGSSDVGQVSYHCPTIQPMWPICQAPWSLHTVEFREETITETSHQAIANGAKLIAGMTYRILTDEAFRQQVQQSYEEARAQKMAE